jgi:hypothetical protein
VMQEWHRHASPQIINTQGSLHYFVGCI